MALSEAAITFSGRKKAGSATQLGILERWKQVAGNPLYEKIFQDAELRGLTGRFSTLS